MLNELFFEKAFSIWRYWLE